MWPNEESNLGVSIPAFNVYEVENQFNIEVEASGMEKKDFKLDLNHNVLIISSEKMKVATNKENLKELTTKLKKKYPSLTDSDLAIINNNEGKMLTLVAYKLRKSKEEMSIIIEGL